jgi:hypothetical protein
MSYQSDNSKGTFLLRSMSPGYGYGLTGYMRAFKDKVQAESVNILLTLRSRYIFYSGSTNRMAT